MKAFSVFLFRLDMMKAFLIPLVFLSIKSTVSYNDFSSLMNANASMIIVIERKFYENKILNKEESSLTKSGYENSLATFRSILVKIARKKMKKSGLNIFLYDDTNVNLAKDYTILMSVGTCHTTWNLFDEAMKENLVHLAITDIDCPRLPGDKGISVPLLDSGEELSQIFYDLRVSKSLLWNRINFIYDDSFNVDEIGKVIKALSIELPNFVINSASTSIYFIKKLSSDILMKREMRNLLEKLPHREPIDDHFVVVISYNKILLFIETARELKMFHPMSQWLFVIPDMAEYSYKNNTFLINYLEEGENIAFLYNETEKHYNIDGECLTRAVCYAKKMTGALAVALEKVLQTEIKLYESVSQEEFEIVNLNKETRRQSILNFLKNEFYNETQDGNTCKRCINWMLTSALTWGNKIGPKNETKPHELKTTGVWSVDNGFQSNNLIFPHSKYGFLGKTLPIAIYHNPPWQMQVAADEANPSNNRRKRSWNGFIVEILEALASALNFTMKLVVVKLPPKIAIAKSNPMKAAMSAAEKIPDAVTHLVEANSVLLAGCAYPGTRNSKVKINLTTPLTTLTYGILSAKPKPVSRALLFTFPYSSEAWALLASSILVVGPILYAIHRFSPYQIDSDKINYSKKKVQGLSTPFKCIWYIYGALLQQGGMNLPKNNGARLMVGTWWLVVMIVVATYSGSLLAFLTFPRMHLPIETVDDLLERRSEFTWSIPAGSYLENHLKMISSQGDLEHQKLLREKDFHADTHDTVSYQQTIDKVKDGHVMIDWINSLMISIRNEHIETGTCDFHLADDVLLLKESISLALPADSPYLKIINIQLERLKEAGLLDKWFTDWMPTEDACMKMHGSSDNHKVNIHDMQGIFFVLFLGYLAGTLFLGWEFFKHKRKLIKERLVRPYVN